MIIKGFKINTIIFVNIIVVNDRAEKEVATLQIKEEIKGIEGSSITKNCPSEKREFKNKPKIQ